MDGKRPGFILPCTRIPHRLAFHTCHTVLYVPRSSQYVHTSFNWVFNTAALSRLMLFIL